MDQHMLLLPLGKEGLYLLTLVRHNEPGSTQHRSLSGSEEENKVKAKLGENSPPIVHHRPAGSAWGEWPPKSPSQTSRIYHDC